MIIINNSKSATLTEERFENNDMSGTFSLFRPSIHLVLAAICSHIEPCVLIGAKHEANDLGTVTVEYNLVRNDRVSHLFHSR